MSESAKVAANSKSESFRRLNPEFFKGGAMAVHYRDPITPVASQVEITTGKRLRQNPKPLMNKLETAFWSDYLEPRYPKARAQAIRFKLANGIAYKPDFVDLTVQPVKAWEVKGPKAFRGGFENLKVAAAAWPEIIWILVWKEDGRWKQQHVLPLQ